MADKANSFNGNTQEGLTRLTLQDIDNKAEFKAQSISISTSGGGAGSLNDKSASTSKAGISGIAGNQATRTGEKETGLVQIFDQEKVKADIDAQVKITTAFGQNATREVARYAQQQLDKAAALKELAKLEQDPDKRAQMERDAQSLADTWAEGKPGRVGLHAVVGGLTGGVGGAFGAAGSAAIAPQIGAVLLDTNLPQTVRNGLLMTVGAAIGGAFGGTSGAVAGYNEVTNNSLGTVIKRVGMPVLIMCLNNTSCRALAGATGIAFAERAQQLMRDNPGLSESNAYTIALTDLSAYGAPPKPVASPPPPPLGTPITPPAGPNNTAGTQLDQTQGSTTTGGMPIAQPGQGSNTTVTPIATPQGPGIMTSQNGNPDPRLPIAEPTIGTNGLPIMSNGKHTPGLPGYNPNAGTEPRNSIDLFNQSIPSPSKPDERFSIDSDGNIHRYKSDNNGMFHWNGSTGDLRAPLNPQLQVPIQIRRLPGVKL